VFGKQTVTMLSSNAVEMYIITVGEEEEKEKGGNDKLALSTLHGRISVFGEVCSE